MVRALILIFLLISSLARASDLEEICSSSIKKAGFVSGDRIRWIQNVIPEFQSVIEHQDFSKLAADNFNYKMQLSKLRLSPQVIEERNQQRIINEAHSSGFNNSITSRLQCTKDFIEKQLPKAVDKFVGCMEPQNRKYCGDSFQTLSGIKENLDVLQAVEKKFQAALIKTYSDPMKADFLMELQSAYKKFAMQVAQAQSKYKDLAEAMQISLEKNKAEYDQVAKKIKGLEDAEKVFARCRSYIHKEGFEDFEDEKQILAQVGAVSGCANIVLPSDQESFNDQMKVVERVGEELKKVQMHKLGTDMFNHTLDNTKRSYLQGYYRIHGSLPSLADFQIATGKNSDDAQIYQSMKSELHEKPVMDIPGEMIKFNEKVTALNQACDVQKTKKDGSSTEQVNLAYQELLQGSSFGSLMSIEEFSNQVGAFDFENCQKNGIGLKALVANDKSKVVKALDKALAVLGKKSRTLIAEKPKLVNSNNPYDGIKYFLKYNPLVVRRMITDNIDPEMASLLCLEIKNVYKDERNHNRLNTALTVVSVSGALVATVLTGGLAAPLMVAALTVGTVNSLNAIDYASVAADSYLQANISGSYDRSVAMGEESHYNTKKKMEAVGLVMNFAPMGVKALAKPLFKTSAVMAIQANLGAKLSAPVANFFNKANSSLGASLDDLLNALAPKYATAASKVISGTMKEFVSGLPEDAAVQFTTLALAFPDPPGIHSEEGLSSLMISMAMSRGLAVVPAKLRTAIFQKKYNQRLTGAQDYFKGLGGEEKTAFDNFKKAVNFDSMIPEAQEEMLLRLHQLHLDSKLGVNSNSKILNVAAFRQELVERGVASSVVDDQIKFLTGKPSSTFDEAGRRMAMLSAQEARAYFQHLPPEKKAVFDEFKSKIGFGKLSEEQQATLLTKLHNVHESNNGAPGEVLFAKKRDLIEVQKHLESLGVSIEDAREQVLLLASKENKILGKDQEERKPSAWKKEAGKKETPRKFYKNEQGYARREQREHDQDFHSKRAALREAMRQFKVPIKGDYQPVRIDVEHGKNPNLLGPKGEPYEVWVFKDLNGHEIHIKHHKYGHTYPDKGIFEYPHFHGPNGEHLSYGMPQE